MSTKGQITVNNMKVPIGNEPNLLELLRNAGLDIPTFCYHSELSVYGACRLCLVDIEGKGLVASCSTKPEDGMVVKTNTEELRDLRKITVELLLANHDNGCTTCAKSTSCKLHDLANRFGVDEIRFKQREIKLPLDTSSSALIRDPNKCILCGDCVRYCREIQSVGAIDFAYRGKDTVVIPAFGNNLGEVECVNCGGCASVCPTGAIMPKPEIQKVWNLINDPSKKVIAQVAPAVRVALGEEFGIPYGQNVIGKIVGALKRIGFDKVYDTSFSADLTVIEEANEFLKRKEQNINLPIFTSCCPAWVKFVEQYYPEIIPNLSSCRSPQQMFGSIAKSMLVKDLEVEKENIAVVSIMPCTAKKYEAQRPEFSENGIQDVDAVITTQELAKMIKESGIMFDKLQPESMDLPFGFATGGGVIFGNSGGVSEAVLRYAYDKITDKPLDNVDFTETRYSSGIKEAEVQIGDQKLKMAIVHGLKNARTIVDRILNKNVKYDIIEVMACPGGCIGGAGQPLPNTLEIRKLRTQGIYDADKHIQMHKAQDNPYVQRCYDLKLKKPNSEEAHHLLHTSYESKKRIYNGGIELKRAEESLVNVKICVGTNCYLKGSQKLISELYQYMDSTDIYDKVSVYATFCHENCGKGPNVIVNDTAIEEATIAKITNVIQSELKKSP